MDKNPIKTDERLEAPIPREKDMDTQMIMGCTGFSLVAFTVYFLAIWPFLVWLNVYNAWQLVLNVAVGFGIAMIVGGLVARRFGLAGAAGFIGGVLPSAIFLYLRMEQAMIAALAQQSPPLQYPASFRFLVPLGLIVAAVLVCLLFARESAIEKESG